MQNDCVFVVAAIRARIVLGLVQSLIGKISNYFCKTLILQFEASKRADRSPFLRWLLKCAIWFCLLGYFIRVRENFSEVWSQSGFVWASRPKLRCCSTIVWPHSNSLTIWAALFRLTFDLAASEHLLLGRSLFQFGEFSDCEEFRVAAFTSPGCITSRDHHILHNTFSRRASAFNEHKIPPSAMKLGWTWVCSRSRKCGHCEQCYFCYWRSRGLRAFGTRNRSVLPHRCRLFFFKSNLSKVL